MVTVVKTPQGHKINTAISATIILGGGDALIFNPYHGRATGDTVYITSDIDEYNGFWYVEVINYQEFQIREHADAENVEFYQEADIEYYNTQPHDWSSIFLPIVYKITNNRWPLNTADTARTVVSSSDDNGFTHLVVSGSLKASLNMLEFVRITGNADSDLNNIWQIAEVISDDEIVINLPYSSSNSFSGAVVQYYYNNYQVRIKVWSGLPASHPWTAKKPYEEMAELSLTPDDNNEVMFSVSDYIKSKVAVKNNLTLFSLPLNLDAFTGFYIETSESYDYSDNYSLHTYEEDFVTDDFEGYAIAGKLPFKNVYAGDYADYIYTLGYPALWLTNAERLLAVEGYYFDVSFIKNVLGNFNLVISKYLTSDYAIIESIPFEDQGIGVYRLPLTIDAQYEAYCMHVETETHEEEIEVPVTTDFDLSLWLNGSEGLVDWNIGIPNPTFNTGGGNSEFLYTPYATVEGQVYSYEYEFDAANTDPGTKTYQLLFLDAAFLAIGFSYIIFPGDGTYSGTVDITPTGDGTYIAIKVSSIGLAMDITAVRVSATSTETEIIEVEGAEITQEICIDILDTCEESFTEEDRRLLEDGEFRLLE